MPKSRSDYVTYRIDQSGGGIESRWLDWVVTLVLAATFAYTTFQLGGHHPRSALFTSVFIAVALVLHGFWMASLPPPSRRLNGFALGFFPFLFFAAASTYAISPVPWTGEEEMLVVAQGTIVFWIVVHNVRTVRHVWFLIGSVLLTGAVCAGISLYQVSVDPDWLPMGRVQAAHYVGRASGTFGNPNNFAALISMLGAFALYLVFTRRMAAGVRILFLTLFGLYLSAIVLSGSRGAWIGWLVVILALPYFVFGQWKHRILCLICALATVGVVGPLLFSLVEIVGQRLEGRFFFEGGRTRIWMWTIAWEIFRDHPLFGSGTGSFKTMFDMYRDPFMQIGPRYAHNEYLNILSDYGVFGFALCMLPAGALLWRGLGVWRSTPFLARPKGGRHRVVPSAKVYLGGILLGFLGLSVHLLVDFHLRIPAVLMLMAIFAGIFVKFSSRRRIRLPARRLSPLIIIAACFVVASALLLHSLTTYMAADHYMKGRDALARYHDQKEALRTDRDLVTEMIRRFETAAWWNPRHALARADAALAHLQRIYTEPQNRTAIARRAQRLTADAVAVSDRTWQAHAYYGMALVMENPPQWEARVHFRRAVALSPSNATAWYYFAQFLAQQGDRREDAMAAIDSVLMLDPGIGGAVALREKLSSE